jgi:Flp pilus assembly pilin Flp
MRTLTAFFADRSAVTSIEYAVVASMIAVAILAGVSNPRLAQWAAGQPDVQLLERRPMPPLDHFSLIRFARVARQAPPAGTRGAGDGKLT